MSNCIANNNTPVNVGTTLDGIPLGEVINASNLINFASTVDQVAAAAASSPLESSTEPSPSAPETRARGARLIISAFAMSRGKLGAIVYPTGTLKPLLKDLRLK